jgi:hypothetical protein
MNRIRFFSDKRAITAVLSNLLLMVVAVGTMSIATTATYVVTTNLRESISERIIVEDLWFCNSTGTVNIYISNVGRVAVDVSAVYINRSSLSFLSPFSLEIGEHRWLNISYTWTSNDLYYVDVVTSRGTHVGGYYEAP